MLIRTMLMFALVCAQGLFASDSPVMRIRCIRDEINSTLTQHGSCVAICDKPLGLDSERSVLTAAHVLDDPKAIILIEAREGHWVRCRVVKIDKSRDLALLIADEDLPVTVELSDGDSLTVVGSKHGEVVRTGAAIPSTIVAHCASFGAGMSGGAVLDSGGKLTGIVTAGIADSKSGDMRPDLCVFITISEIRAFLKGE